MKNKLKKPSIILIVIALIVLVLFYNSPRITQKMMSQVINEAVSRKIVQMIPENQRSTEHIVEAMNRYVFLNVRPYGKSRDERTSWVLINGEGWCDTVSAAFLKLIGTINERGYLAFLKVANGSSPHSVAYWTPGDLSVRDLQVDYLQKNAVVVDPQNNIIYRQDPHTFASPHQICEGLVQLPAIYKDQKSYYCTDPHIFLHNRPISTQSFIHRWFYKDIFPHIPEEWIKGYLWLALQMNTELKPVERIYFWARVQQIFFNYQGALEGYSKVKNEFPNTRWAKLSFYWSSFIIRIPSTDREGYIKELLTHFDDADNEKITRLWFEVEKDFKSFRVGPAS